MNVYIYDDFLNKSKYNRAINRLEIKLTDLGLNGKIVRLGAIKNIHDAVEGEIKNGAKPLLLLEIMKPYSKPPQQLLNIKL